VLVALACPVAVAPAQAARHHSRAGGIPRAPLLMPMNVGFAGDQYLTDIDLTGESRQAEFYWNQRAASFGSRIVRVNVTWSNVAPKSYPAGFNPTDPGSPYYYWRDVDSAVRAIVAAGEQPDLMIYLAPDWAEGPGRPNTSLVRDGTWMPDPAQFGYFAKAIATRYSGYYQGLPRVIYYQAWNEENLGYYLNPVWTSSSASGQPASPNVYRPMLDSFYNAVKSVSPGNVVLMGGTAPYGDPPTKFWLGGPQRMPPLTFYRTLFCMNPQAPCVGPPPEFDVVDHHPYEVPPPQFHAIHAGDVAVPDVWQITRLVKAAVNAGDALPRARKQVWAGELSWDSNPPSSNFIAAPIADQACYYELSQFELWHEGADAVLFEQVRDMPPAPPWQATFRWGGILFYNGQPKPTATAFQFPFVAIRASRGRVELWGRAPRSGLLVISARTAYGASVTVARLRINAGQVFDRFISYRGPIAFQAQVGRSHSLAWTHPKPACPSTHFGT
jgi:hypothetical protein